MNKYIYVDNSSTTKLNEKVLRKMLPYLQDYYGNASTIYELGKISRNAIDVSRNIIAKCINADTEEIYFTGSGTESDNIAIQGIAYKYKDKGKHIITSKFEHLAVLNTCKKLEDEGFEVTYLDVGESGVIDINKVKEAIREDTILISIMYVNNEIGTIQDVYEIAKLARENNIIFHTDAVQAIPHLDIDASKFDLMSISSHKFNGPKGVGALYIRKGLELSNIICGGHQEREIRPGTENVAGIVGMAEALKITKEELEQRNEKEKKLQEYFLKKLKQEIPNVSINGDLEKRIYSNINISIDGIDSSELMVFLDMSGICASSGSACNSSSKELSHVLKAIGQNNSSIRFTLSSDNTFYEIDRIVYILKNSIDIIKCKKKCK
ncbi:MAG: cysteine desulfurase [Clostridia bacterium]|nr:cysteine desulfurase [Clostridia bacterium]